MTSKELDKLFEYKKGETREQRIARILKAGIADLMEAAAKRRTKRRKAILGR